MHLSVSLDNRDTKRWKCYIEPQTSHSTAFHPKPLSSTTRTQVSPFLHSSSKEEHETKKNGWFWWRNRVAWKDKTFSNYCEFYSHSERQEFAHCSENGFLRTLQTSFPSAVLSEVMLFLQQSCYQIKSNLIRLSPLFNLSSTHESNELFLPRSSAFASLTRQLLWAKFLCSRFMNFLRVDISCVAYLLLSLETSSFMAFACSTAKGSFSSEASLVVNNKVLMLFMLHH